MKNRFFRKFLLSFFTIIFIGGGVFAQIKEVKISGDIVATINKGDFVYPKFSPDSKWLALSNVLIEEMENTEVQLFNLQSKRKVTLLNGKTAKKYAVYAAFVSDLEWLGLNKLRVSISDGDVDSTALTFNTQTFRIVKTEYSSADDEDVPAKTSPLAKILYRTFPGIDREYIGSAVNRQQAFKIGNRGTVIQYSHADADSNLWFLDMQTRKSNLLLEKPQNAEKFYLKGALETDGKLLLIVGDSDETQFYIHRGGKTELIGKTDFGGDFEVKFSNPSKGYFFLKQPNNESEKPSSLWYFDGKILSRVSDIENLCDADIDKTGKIVAFSYWNKAEKRDISVRKIKPGF